MYPRIKICGLTRPNDVQAAIGYGADFLGFIIEAASPRRLTVRRAAQIGRPAKHIASIVAVTVNADDQLLADICSDLSPDFIQCHGDETPQRVRDIRSEFGVPVIKALPISSASDLERISDYDCDHILLDAKPPREESHVRGGHGLSFDWQLLKGQNFKMDWILAGGLTANNVQKAIEQTKAPILDISSGVEQKPGLKDPTKLRDFVRAVKSEPI